MFQPGRSSRFVGRENNSVPTSYRMIAEIKMCSLCGREILGPAFYRHSDACRKKHGQSSGMVWREIGRRTAMKSASLLRALSKSPAQHIEDICGLGPISPQDVIDALAISKSRNDLNWKMSCCSFWHREIEGDGKLWPENRRAQLWDAVWEAYRSAYKRCGGAGAQLAPPDNNAESVMPLRRG